MKFCKTSFNIIFNKFQPYKLEKSSFLYQVKIGFMHPIPSSYPDISVPRPTEFWKLPNLSNIIIIFHFEPPFILVASTTAKMCRVLVEKMAKKCQFFTFFVVTRQNFLGSRWNISTNEPVSERLLNFWIFGTYFKLIAHLVRAREPSKAKKSKIRVTRKPDLETQNWVYNFSSFIEPYQTHIVTAQMLSTFFHLLDRVINCDKINCDKENTLWIQTIAG